MGLATIDPHSQKELTEIYKIPTFGVNQASFHRDKAIWKSQNLQRNVWQSGRCPTRRQCVRSTAVKRLSMREKWKTTSANFSANYPTFRLAIYQSSLSFPFLLPIIPCFISLPQLTPAPLRDLETTGDESGSHCAKWVTRCKMGHNMLNVSQSVKWVTDCKMCRSK